MLCAISDAMLLSLAGEDLFVIRHSHHVSSELPRSHYHVVRGRSGSLWLQRPLKISWAIELAPAVGVFKSQWLIKSIVFPQKSTMCWNRSKMSDMWGWPKWYASKGLKSSATAPQRRTDINQPGPVREDSSSAMRCPVWPRFRNLKLLHHRSNPNQRVQHPSPKTRPLPR